MRIGLLGGSFDPAHEGHVHISIAALKALELDAVWWLVSPQNPLKSKKPLPTTERVQIAEKLIEHPKILVSTIEDELQTQITYHTIRKIKRAFPYTEFAWITGMDNALSLHTWQNWQELLGEICMLHLSRAPIQSLVRSCPLRMLSHHKHINIKRGAARPLDSGTTYWMMQKNIVEISSSDIRKKQS